jgi:hypothetical protein
MEERSVRQRIASALVLVVLGAVAAWGQPAKNDPLAAEQLRAAYGQMASLTSYRMGIKMAPEPETGGGGPTGGMTMVMEVVPPDRFRVTSEMDDTTMEMILIGGEIRYRLTKVKEEPAEPSGGMGFLGFLNMAVSIVMNPAGALMEAAPMVAGSMMSRGMGRPPVGVWQCPPKMGGGAPASSGAAGGGPGPGDGTAVSRLDDTTIDGAATLVFLSTRATGGQGAGTTTRVYVLKDRGLPRRIEMLDASGKPTMTTDYSDYNAPITIPLPQCGQKT